jgi:ribosomal protein S18 acetylase RimI-like enzyme
VREATVTPVNPDDLMAQATEISAIHQAAFADSDERASRFRDVDIPKMSGHAGFACVVALTDNQPVGYALGHDAAARQDWLRNVMSAARGTPVERWLPDAWYLAEIATLPELQGRGIGRQMHDVLMDLTADRHRVLVTYHGDHPAKRFYRRLGWAEVIPDLAYVPEAPLSSLMVYVGRKP